MKTFNFLLLSAVIFLATSSGYSAELKRTVTVNQVTGEVMMKDAGAGPWSPAAKGSILNEGSFLKTGPAAKAVLSVDGIDKTALVEVGEKSFLSFATLIKDSASGTKKTLLDLAMGQVLIKAEKLDTPDSKFEVKTPTSVVGVRGTKFSVKVDALK